MGIFGALTTAVTGMRAQSFALENISGNIANSQTTAFKRIDTSFVDLIPDSIPTQAARRQRGRRLRARPTPCRATSRTPRSAPSWRSTATASSSSQKPSSFADNRPVFDGIDLYTRRGDFQPDKNGYLVNGAGYYLMGIPVDPTTGNLVGSVPQLLQVPERLPAGAGDDRDRLPRQPRELSADARPRHRRSRAPNCSIRSNFSANPIGGAAAAGEDHRHRRDAAAGCARRCVTGTHGAARRHRHGQCRHVYGQRHDDHDHRRHDADPGQQRHQRRNAAPASPRASTRSNDICADQRRCGHRQSPSAASATLPLLAELGLVGRHHQSDQSADAERGVAPGRR